MVTILATIIQGWSPSSIIHLTPAPIPSEEGVEGGSQNPISRTLPKQQKNHLVLTIMRIILYSYVVIFVDVMLLLLWSFYWYVFATIGPTWEFQVCLKSCKVPDCKLGHEVAL